jgi:alpha-N-arabinofuranosidase
MRYRPLASGDEAGIVAFQSSDYWYFLGVTLVDGRPVIELQERAGDRTQGKTEVLASAPLVASTDSTIYLTIRARGALYDFSYAYHPGAWVLLKGDADGTILSTKVAGGFVGTMLGMYAYHPAP